MRNYPNLLEDTALWKLYEEKGAMLDSKRKDWLKEIYTNSVTWLKAVPCTFSNYTLHDETHVLNIIHIMGSLLGKQRANLSVAEIELLILSAALHDIGMVYDENDQRQEFENVNKCRKFITDYYPEYIGCAPEEWTQAMRQNYLRSRHPFRLHEILTKEKWQKLFHERPHDIITENYLIAVCQAHGEDMKEIRNNPNLKYLADKDADLTFCAMLLRLADLLDFDDSRAPQILFEFAQKSSKSVEEWQKHMSSGGFIFPAEPSSKELLYSAEFTDPETEHAALVYLNWIDEELSNCMRLQNQYHHQWQREFPFPQSISRDGIERKGYLSAEFKITMDQNHILNLLMGENIYNNNNVFIRELLQNSVDATLLRSKLDHHFDLNTGSIAMWHWTDSEGNSWFRIDDQGTGMTLGMIQRYFLKAGNSYYTSNEIKKDLLKHGVQENHYAISRFGIGFLSCFLCGKSVEISTLYYDDQKNNDEHGGYAPGYNEFGLRMQVDDLNGYFVVKSQADGHVITSPLPRPINSSYNEWFQDEYNGYRSKAGTSIVIKLDPNKLSLTSLKDIVNKYVLGVRMPVFFNGARIGMTYHEAMALAKEQEGCRILEFSESDKKKFDYIYPQFKGRYPKFKVDTFPISSEKYPVPDHFSGIIRKYSIVYDNCPQWEFKDQKFELAASINPALSKSYVSIYVQNKAQTGFIAPWNRLAERYGAEIMEQLETEFKKREQCPSSYDELGEFKDCSIKKSENLSDVWKSYLNYAVNPTDCVFEIPKASQLDNLTSIDGGMRISYQGVSSGEIGSWETGYESDFICFLEEELNPSVDIGRSSIQKLPFEAIMAISTLLCLPHLNMDYYGLSMYPNRISLSQWRAFRATKLGDWILQSHQQLLKNIVTYFSTIAKINKDYYDNNIHFLGQYSDCEAYLRVFMFSYLQDNYDMKINYEAGQIISFEERQKADDFLNTIDQFPPMLFCEAASTHSQTILCNAFSESRRCITLDHPFVQWLIKNAPIMRQFFARQLDGIIFCLCNNEAEDIIKIVNAFIDNSTNSLYNQKLDFSDLKKLTTNDFYYED